jgi:hypothetical protein
MMKSYGDKINSKTVGILGASVLTPSHAQSFAVFMDHQDQKYLLNKIIKGDAKWPRKPDQRDSLHYLAMAFRDQLIKQVPQERSQMGKKETDFVYRATEMIRDLADISGELAQILILPNEDGEGIPAWYLTEIAVALPRLAGR